MGWPSDEKQPLWDSLDPDLAHILDQQPPIVNPSAPEDDTNFRQLAQNFVKKQNRILLKRDQTTTNHPCPNDLEVGELVLNAVTGNLYTKLVTGRIIMYKPSSVCDLTQISTDYTASLVISETCDSVCSVSGHGISFTSGARNTIRFNPVELKEGLPISLNIKFIAPNGAETLIGRVSAISDYKTDMSFEVLYYPDPASTNFLPLVAKFGQGIYNNGSLGSIKVETL